MRTCNNFVESVVVTGSSPGGIRKWVWNWSHGCGSCVTPGIGAGVIVTCDDGRGGA